MVFMSVGVVVLCAPNRGARKPGTGTGFSLSSWSRRSVENGTSRRTCFLIRTSVADEASNGVGCMPK